MISQHVSLWCILVICGVVKPRFCASAMCVLLLNKVKAKTYFQPCFKPCVYMEGLGAACGTGDSDGKHDCKHYFDTGLVNWCHNKIRCACCFICFCKYCSCILTAKESKAVIAFIFLGMVACQKSCCMVTQPLCSLKHNRHVVMGCTLGRHGCVPYMMARLTEDLKHNQADLLLQQ